MAYVCLCNSVTEGGVRGAIGAGARCVDSVARACGAGADCFSCHTTIESLLSECQVRLPRLQKAS
jgi:bacterioferritin-associated ferredoxin